MQERKGRYAAPLSCLAKVIQEETPHPVIQRRIADLTYMSNDGDYDWSDKVNAPLGQTHVADKTPTVQNVDEDQQDCKWIT